MWAALRALSPPSVASQHGTTTSQHTAPVTLELMPVFFSVNCGAGKHQSLSGTSFCVPCGPGKFTSADGQASCTNCDSGAVAFAFGSQSCGFCPAGRFSIKNATSGAADCHDCQRGKTSQQGSSFCSDCQVGWTRPAWLPSS